MNNFFDILIQKFSNLINLYNKLLSNFFNKLNYKNFSILIVDKRVVITTVVIIVSIVAHFSTPAFYKTDRVKNLLENQLGNEFNFNFDLNNDVHYAMFPRPHFHFKNISLNAEGKKFASIESFRIYLSFKKFFEKEKLKIQYLKIKKAKFNFEITSFPILLKFFDKKLSKLDVDIYNSNIFLKDNDDGTLSILKLDKGKINYDAQILKNRLLLNGEIFNNPVILSMKNDFDKKNLNLDLDFEKIGIQLKNEINYAEKIKSGLTIVSNYGKNHPIYYSFDKKQFSFKSGKKNKELHLFEGTATLKPFFLKTNINVKDISLKNLIQAESLFMKLVRSNLFLSKNLNLVLNVNSQEVKDYRLLDNLLLKMELNQGILSFKDSSIELSEIASIKLLNGNFKKKDDLDYFSAEFDINIFDSAKLYKLFQTKKKYRRKIDNINFVINYDFQLDTISIERISIDRETNDSMQNFVKDFNTQENQLKNRVELRNLFNFLIESYEG